MLFRSGVNRLRGVLTIEAAQGIGDAELSELLNLPLVDLLSAGDGAFSLLLLTDGVTPHLSGTLDEVAFLHSDSSLEEIARVFVTLFNDARLAHVAAPNLEQVPRTNAVIR